MDCDLFPKHRTEKLIPTEVCGPHGKIRRQPKNLKAKGTIEEAKVSEMTKEIKTSMVYLLKNKENYSSIKQKQEIKQEGTYWKVTYENLLREPK